MKINIAYIGLDEKYFKRLQAVFKKEFPELQYQFTFIPDLKTKDHKEVFLNLHDKDFHIIYIDYSTNEDKAFSLSKLISKNNEMRVLATVGLFDYGKGGKLLRKALNTELRLYHYKSLEIADVVFDPISILDVNIVQNLEYISCDEFEEIEILQPLRVGYIEDNHFHVETNSYIEEGEIIDVDTHPLVSIMPSKKLYVAAFDNKNLYYNKRFSYDLEFIYIDNDFFVSTNKNWVLYKTLKNFPEQFEELDPIVQEEITEDMEKRKEAYLPIRSKIDTWLDIKKDETFPKKLKILILDHSLEFIREVEGKIEDFPYSLNVQSKLTFDYYQIQRTMPHLIVFRFDKDINNERVLKEIIKKIESHKNYDPYILFFNSKDIQTNIKKSITYKNIMFYPNAVHLDEIRNMAKMLDKKLSITDVHTKIYPNSHDENSQIMYRKKVKVMKMTESVIYFKSKVEVPMWTVFMVQEPVKMILTVVPKRDDDEFKNEEHYYRCLVNGVGELEKSKLRQLINRNLMVEEQ